MPHRARHKARLNGLIRDITAQKNAATEIEKSRVQLNQAQKKAALGSLVAGVAHEINNPINLIMYNTPLLRKVWEDILPVLQARAPETPLRKYGGLTIDFLDRNLLQLVSGIEACLKLGAYRPDPLILDIFMPDMDGVEMCRALRKDPALAQVKVIVTTGHPQHPKLAEVNRLGFKNIRSKPYNVSELIEFIDNILTARSKSSKIDIR